MGFFFVGFVIFVPAGEPLAVLPASEPSAAAESN
jgi:hypothetical protein